MPIKIPKGNIYPAEQFSETFRGRGVTSGKFIRVSSRVFFSVTPFCLHRDIAFGVYVENPDKIEKDKIWREGEKAKNEGTCLRGEYPGLQDAGHYKVDLSSKPPTITLSGESSDFGRANDTERNITKDIVGIAMRDTVEIIAN
jgi:hypothetical protein